MKLFALFVGACGLVPVVFADTATFYPVADTTISQNNGALANGGTGHMIVGHLDPGHANVPARGLVRFDLSSLPAGAVVTSATVGFTVTISASGSVDPHKLHRVTLDWLEATATWVNSGLDSWETSGGDFEQTTDATVPVGGAGPFTFLSTTALVSTVQMWATNSASNFGWLLRSQAEDDGRNARRINTRESAGNQPVLTVGYTAPPVVVEPVTLQNPRISEGNFIFDFTALPGTSYTVQYKSTVDPGGWDTLQTYPDPMGESVITVQDPLTAENRFYRVVSP